MVKVIHTEQRTPVRFEVTDSNPDTRMLQVIDHKRGKRLILSTDNSREFWNCFNWSQDEWETFFNLRR